MKQAVFNLGSLLKIFFLYSALPKSFLRKNHKNLRGTKICITKQNSEWAQSTTTNKDYLIEEIAAASATTTSIIKLLFKASEQSFA